MIKAINKLGIGEIYTNIIKFTYDKPTANIVLYDERLKDLPLSGIR